MIISVVLSSHIATGTVRLQVTDSHGKPIANRQIWLAPTNSTKSVRPFGYQWWLPDAPTTLTGKTDKAGNVSISGVQKGKPMMIITRFGPPFDAYVQSQYHTPHSMDVMKMDGAVYVDKPARVVVSDDYEILGRVTKLETGGPVPGVEVILLDTLMGHMSGYPLTPLDKTITKTDGTYSFRRLPNCDFTVFLGKVTPSSGVESKAEFEPWTYMDITDAKGESSMRDIRGLTYRKPRAYLNFRLSQIAYLTTTIRKGTFSTMRGWILWMDRVDVHPRANLSGNSLDWADPNHPNSKPKKEEVFTRSLIPGTYLISVERNSDHRRYDLKRIQMKSGENQRVELNLSSIVGTELSKKH